MLRSLVIVNGRSALSEAKNRERKAEQQPLLPDARDPLVDAVGDLPRLTHPPPSLTVESVAHRAALPA